MDSTKVKKHVFPNSHKIFSFHKEALISCPTLLKHVINDKLVEDIGMSFLTMNGTGQKLTLYA